MEQRNIRSRSYLILAILGIVIAVVSIWRVGSLKADQEIQAAVVQPRKVGLHTVGKHSFVEWAYAEGTVQAARREYLQLETPGIVTELGRIEGQILREGVRVAGPTTEKPGDLLMRIDARTQTAEQKAILAQLIEARTAMEQAEREFERAEKIFQRKLISQNEFEARRADRDARRAAFNAALAQQDRSQVSLDKAILRAPFDGVISRVNVREGDFYAGPQPAVTDDAREVNAAMVLMDTGHYEATLNLPLWDDSRVKAGQTVYLSSSASVLSQAAETDFVEGHFATGSITSISPSISLDKRAVTVKVLTESGEEFLRDGSFVTAWIVVDERDDVLAIPFEAVSGFESGEYVYVYERESGTVRQQSLTMGTEGTDLVEVLGGISAGMEVIIQGKKLLTDGTPVIIAGE